MNNFEVRNTNKKRIINFLYGNNGSTKQQIADSLGLSVPTVSLILKDLAGRGLVKQSGTLQSSGGRKPAAISLEYGAKLSAGIEITQGHLRFVLIDLSETILYEKRIRVPFENSDRYFRALAEHTKTFLSESGAVREKLLGVGLALPGLVNAKSDLLEYSPTLRVRNLPLKVLTEYLPGSVSADNEANLAGFAEIWNMGSVENAVYLSINKGVGGAIIIGNQLYNGSNGRAGEFGHMTIVKDGRLCSCGKRGCLEAYCSTRVLLGKEFADTDAYFAELKAGNGTCARRWNDYLNYLAAGINNIHTIFDCDVILGGEIDWYLEMYSRMLQKRLDDLDPFGARRGYLHFSRFKDKAGVVGAALLPVDAFFKD